MDQADQANNDIKSKDSAKAELEICGEQRIISLINVEKIEAEIKLVKLLVKWFIGSTNKTSGETGHIKIIIYINCLFI